MEIQAKDLREGNYVFEDVDEVKVSAMRIAVYNYAKGLIKPIPLTEEWLLKFGWGADSDFDNTYINNVGLKNEVMFYDTDNKVFLIETERDTIELSHIKHVHQLQNLYFALTGEELTIK